MPQLQFQRRLAADIMKCALKRVQFEEDGLDEVREAITRDSVRDLIEAGVINRKPITGISRGRARKILVQKRKGRKSGQGSRKGKSTARLPKKTAWAAKVRTQRALLKELRDKGVLSSGTYRVLYRKSKGGFFRSRRHIKLYIDEQNLVEEKK